jgi:DNA replication protein DnaC
MRAVWRLQRIGYSPKKEKNWSSKLHHPVAVALANGLVMDEEPVAVVIRRRLRRFKTHGIISHLRNSTNMIFSLFHPQLTWKGLFDKHVTSNSTLSRI